MHNESTVPTTVINKDTEKERMNWFDVMTNFIVSNWKPTGNIPTFPEITAHSSLTDLDNTFAKGSRVARVISSKVP
jgi:hypothetical protein